MRVLGLLVLGAALCGDAMALEAAAGADTVNTSQIGLDAKLNATNTILTTSINQVLNCQKTGKLFDPTSNSCITVDEPLAKKIAACTTNKQFYNQNTGACVNSAPDLTSNLATTNTNLNNATNLLNAVLNCNRAHMFYNSAAGICEGGGGAGISSVIRQQCRGSNCTTPACPTNYFLTGCSYGLPGAASAYIGVGPSGNSCVCSSSHGGNSFTCTAFCAR